MGPRPDLDLDPRAREVLREIVLQHVASGEAIGSRTLSKCGKFQLSPATRPLIKYAALKLGPDKGNSLHLNRLFKGTPAKLAAKLAGLPKPTNCL